MVNSILSRTLLLFTFLFSFQSIGQPFSSVSDTDEVFMADTITKPAVRPLPDYSRLSEDIHFACDSEPSSGNGKIIAGYALAATGAELLIIGYCIQSEIRKLSESDTSHVDLGIIGWLPYLFASMMSSTFYISGICCNLAAIPFFSLGYSQKARHIAWKEKCPNAGLSMRLDFRLAASRPPGKGK
jgi:hypothetical protein